MKTLKTIALFAAACAALLISSCKKSDQAKETTNLLTTAAWKTGATEWQTTAGAWVSPPTWAADEYPATITFLDSGTYTAGATSGTAGTWQLSSDRSQLVLVSAKGSSLTLTIAALTSGTLQLAHPLTSGTYDYNAATRTTTYFSNARTTFSH